MAAIVFPSNPTTNQVFFSANQAWQWDGVAWLSYSPYADTTHVVSAIDCGTPALPQVLLNLTSSIASSGGTLTLTSMSGGPGGTNTGITTTPVAGFDGTYFQTNFDSSIPAGSIIKFNGTTAVAAVSGTDYWGLNDTVSWASAIAGGAANQILIQEGDGTTGFILEPTVTGSFLGWNGTTIDWYVPTVGTGDVIGPASATNSNFAAFDTTTGKLLKDSGVSSSSFAVAGHTHTGTYEPADITILKQADIGSLVQAYDSDLTLWAAISPSAKQDALVSGTNIKTINGTSLLGSGNIVISGGGGGSATATYVRSTFTPTAGQTSFNAAYTVDYLEVYINGVLLAPSDITATNGTSFTIAAVSATDIVECIAYNVATINVTDASSLATGTVPTARLGSGTADSTTYLRGDQTWATVSSFTADQAYLTNLFFG